MKKSKKKKPLKKKVGRPKTTFVLKGKSIKLKERLGYTSKSWSFLKAYCESRDGGKICCKHSTECFGPIQLHHKKPLSKGGTNRPSNLEWICHLHHCLEHPFMIRDLIKKYYK